MNSRERVEACIRREKIDAVPLAFYAVDHDTVSKVLGRPTFVRNKVGIRLAIWEGRREEVAESLKRDSVEFYRKIELCDLITWKEADLLPPKDYQPGRVKKLDDSHYEDEKGCVYQLSWETNEIICVKNPEMESKEWTLEDFEKPLPVPEPDPSVFEAHDYFIGQLAETRYITGHAGGLDARPLLGGMERGLMAYALQPEVVKAAVKRFAELHNALDKFYCRPQLPGVLIEEDLCSTKGPMLSPAMYREFCLPAFKSRIEHIKKVTGGAQVIFHSCGNSRKILDQFIEAGVEVLQSIQAIPEMWVGDLKKEVGDRLVLWGGIPVEELILGTPESMRKAVRKAMEAAAPGGGFILGPSHSVAYGTKYENFMAMLDEFDKLRFKFAS
jgi:hypothetical protein